MNIIFFFYFGKYYMPKKNTYNKVKHNIESKGCSLISNEYMNNKTHLDIKMRCGHISKVRYDQFLRLNTYKCRKCSEIDKCNDNVQTVIDLLHNHDCVYISSDPKYISNNTKITYIAKCGHETTYKWRTIKDKPVKCKLCLRKVSKDKIINELENRGSQLISINRQYLLTMVTYKAECNCIVTEDYRNILRVFDFTSLLFVKSKSNSEI